MRFAFITRHEPTPEQFSLAQELGIELVPVGDMDAFEVTPGMIHDIGDFEGVVVVHPAAALRLANDFVIGIFENANRAPEGEKPQFKAVRFHVYDYRG